MCIGANLLAKLYVPRSLIGASVIRQARMAARMPSAAWSGVASRQRQTRRSALSRRGLSPRPRVEWTFHAEVVAPRVRYNKSQTRAPSASSATTSSTAICRPRSRPITPSVWPLERSLRPTGSGRASSRPHIGMTGRSLAYQRRPLRRPCPAGQRRLPGACAQHGSSDAGRGQQASPIRSSQVTRLRGRKRPLTDRSRVTLRVTR